MNASEHERVADSRQPTKARGKGIRSFEENSIASGSATAGNCRRKKMIHNVVLK